MSRWPSPKFLLIVVLLYPFQITEAGYLEWALPIPRRRHRIKVALEGRAIARLKLVTFRPPKTTCCGEFWITSYRLGSGGGAFFYSAVALRLMLHFL